MVKFVDSTIIELYHYREEEGEERKTLVGVARSIGIGKAVSAACLAAIPATGGTGVVAVSGCSAAVETAVNKAVGTLINRFYGHHNNVPITYNELIKYPFYTVDITHTFNINPDTGMKGKRNFLKRLRK